MCLINVVLCALPAAQRVPVQDLVKTRGKGKDYESEILSYINSPITNLIVAVTVQQLSTHSDDEQLLDEPNTLLTVRHPGHITAGSRHCSGMTLPA